MGWLGRFQLGDWLPLQVRVKNTSGVPTLPDDVPTVRILDADGTEAENFKLPIKDRYTITALFQDGRLLDSTYSAGRYTVLYEYAVSATTYSQEDYFEIVAGGNDDGQVIGVFYYERPHGRFVLHATDDGIFLSGRNPT